MNSQLELIGLIFFLKQTIKLINGRNIFLNFSFVPFKLFKRYRNFEASFNRLKQFAKNLIFMQAVEVINHYCGSKLVPQMHNRDPGKKF